MYDRAGELFSYVDLWTRFRWDHAEWAIRQLVNEAVVGLEWELAALYLRIGRPLIAPDQLFRGMLCQAFYSVRAAADGGAGRRSAVPLVRWSRSRGSGVESLVVLGEALASRSEVPVGSAGAAGGEGVVERALLGLERRAGRPVPVTQGADMACDTEDVVGELRSIRATRQVAEK